MNQNYEKAVAVCEGADVNCGKRPSVCDIVKENGKLINEIGAHLAYIRDTVDPTTVEPTDCAVEAEPNSLLEDLTRQQRRLVALLRMSAQLRDSICG